jgi:hypothetical protein
MGKFKREFTVWQPSMINLSKLNTLAQSRTTVPPKRQKLGDGVSLQVGASLEDHYTQLDIVTWPEMFTLIVRSWSIAGAYDVPEQKDSAKPARCANSATWTHFAWNSLRRLRLSGSAIRADQSSKR